jgi:hypothetical protein
MVVVAPLAEATAMKRLAFVLLLLGCDSRTSEPIDLDAGPSLRVQLPARAGGVLHVERAPGVFVDVRAIGARDVNGVRTAEGVIYEGAFESTRVLHLASLGRTEEIRYVTKPTEPVLRYAVRLGAKLERLTVVEDYVEARDANGIARLRTEPASLVDARGKKHALVPSLSRAGDEWSLTFAYDPQGLVYPIEIDPAWTTTAHLAHARRDHTMTTTASGKVVALGGLGIASTSLSSVEIYDEATASWTSGGNLLGARYYNTSILLGDGRILTVGALEAPVPAPEIYDPVTETSTALPDVPDQFGVGTGLANLAGNQVLAIGPRSFVLDVAKKTWTEVFPAQSRLFALLAPIAGGKILVAGGDDGSKNLSSAEIYDPATKTFTATGTMNAARDAALVQPIAGGKVLAAGGIASDYVPVSSAEIFDPATGKWTLTPPMSERHSFCRSELLPDGRVIVMGGDIDDGVTDATDLYDPTTNTWVYAGALGGTRDEFASAVLPSGKVIISGGSNGPPLNITEIFDPLKVGLACTGPGECASGHCVDGFCCEAATCAADETCGGTGGAGKCLKRDGVTCADGAACGSGHCVDGVCCDTACDDVCAACDVTGKVGTCTATPAGDAPHGTRASCPGEGACRARCGGVETSKCTQFPGSAVTCGDASCEGGTETRLRGCDGAGACAAGVTHACSPYVCGATACKTQCEEDKDCVDGNSCDRVTRKCVVASTCDGDHVVTSPDGKPKDCTPYRCDGPRCLASCDSSASCVDGFVCDTTAHHCVPGASDSGDSGGCTWGTTRARSNGWIALLMLLAAIRMRSRSWP